MLNLTGHSGCELIFINSGEKLIIRKISKDVSYNNRLNKQFIKQKEFFHDQIKAPLILDSGYVNNLFYFDMEYINGIRFNDYVKIKKFEDVKNVFTVLVDFIVSNFDDNLIFMQDEILFKIESIAETNLIDPNTLIELSTLSNEPLFSGYCHGDLTFENIIIAQEKIYLIDFLDSYIDSPIIDISKLFQEFDLNWSNRNEISKNNLAIIRNIFLKRILYDKVMKFGVNPRSLLLQQKLTLMRILPYTNSITLKLKLIELINN